MKAKTIRITLARKFHQFLESIQDADLRERVKKGTIITGGAIASMLLKEPVNDFDLYFRTKDLAFDVAKYFVAKFKENPPTTFQGVTTKEVLIEAQELPDRIRIFIKSAGVASSEGTGSYQYFESQPDDAAEEYANDATRILSEVDDAPGIAVKEERPTFRPIFLSANAITLSDRVQIIVRFFGEPAEIHDNYDFQHCTAYWQSWDGALVLPPAALEALLARELRYVGSKYPLCSIIRTRKFLARGWTINAGQYLKMAFQLGQLDLTKVGVLEDQLIGVDSAYFVQLVARLHEKDPEKVDGAYLMAIIDKIF